MHFKRLNEFFKRTPGTDSILLASWDAASGPDANFYYYSGLQLDRATFIARKGSSPILIVNPLNAELAKERFEGEIIEFKPGDYLKLLASCLKGYKKLAIAKSSITASLYENIKKSTKAAIYDASTDFLLQRAVKSGEEIAAVKKASSIAHKAFKSLELRPGKTEEELQREMQLLILEYGAEPSFKPIIAFGPNSRFPHAESGKRKLKRGEIVLVDWGAKWKGYCSDHTRCIFLGEPNKRQERTYEKLKQVSSQLISSIEPGMPVKEITTNYCSLLADAGLPKPPHGLGHGIGLEVHEYPSFAAKSSDIIADSSTLAIEPAAYFKDFGARFEETIVVKKKAKVLK